MSENDNETLDLTTMLAKMAEAKQEIQETQENTPSVKELAAEAGLLETETDPEPVIQETQTAETETQEAEDAELVSAELEDPATSEKPHRDKGAEKRIAKIIKEREQLRGELEALKNSKIPETNPQVQVSPEQLDYTIFDNTAPKPQNYKNGVNDIDYVLDARDYVRKEQQKHQDFVVKLTEAQTKDTELANLLAIDIKTNRSAISPLLEATIKNSPVAIPLFKHLLANPKLSHTLVNLSPTGLAHEIGKLEAKLEMEQAGNKPVKKVEKLPEPITPVRNTSTTTVKKSNFTFY